jgi:DmsE family decaheme c-type cytochrome
MQASLMKRTHPKWLTTILVLLSFISSLSLFALSSDAKPSGTQAQSNTSAQYVGSETCKTCHEDVYTHTQQTPHFKMKFLGKPEGGSPPAGVDCESCHGPGSAHVEGGGDVSKIISFKELTTAQVSNTCLGCHESGSGQRHFSQSVHAANNVGCLSCHSVHHASQPQRLLVRSQLTLCYTCHTTQKAEFSKPFRHRVNEGLLTCTDCHNPHGTTIPHQLETSAGDQQVCYKCHTDKQGPFAFEHVPVRAEGCTSCHQVHGSTNPRMLRVSQVNLLCLQCHTVTPNSNVPGIPSFHNQAQKYQACTLCHTRIHGSNFNEFFFK